VKFSNDFNLANDALVEGSQLVRRNPKLLVIRIAHSLDRILRGELFANAKPRHITRSRILYVPITGNLDGVTFGEDGIEYWLLRQTRRKGPIAAGANQFQFLRPDRAEECYGVVRVRGDRNTGAPQHRKHRGRIAAVNPSRERGVAFDYCPAMIPND